MYNWSSLPIIAVIIIVLGAASASAQQPNAAHATAGRTYSLSELLAYATRHSPQIAVAKAERTRWRAEQRATSPMLPSDLRINGSLGRRTTRAGSGWDYSVAFSQELEIAGQRGARRRAASAGVQVGEAELEQARKVMHQKIRAAFHAALVARERSVVAGRFTQFATQLVAIARRRLAVGETSRIPLGLAEAELANARQEAVRAAAQYRQECLLLAELVGWSSSEPPAPAGSLPEPRRLRPVAELARFARGNPDLRVRGERVKWALARLAAADRNAWPNPQLGVQYARESGPGLEDAADIWQGTVSVPLPIWGANRPERARAEAELDVARAEQAARRQTLPLRVARGAQAANASADRISALGGNVLPNLHKTLASIERAFELGEIDISEVMIAREQLLRAELAMLDAYDDYYRAAAELELEVGRDVVAPQ